MNPTIPIRTGEAKSLILGRQGRPGQPTIYGLLTFARIVGNIVNESSNDNPYADCCLISVETQFQKCRSLFAELRRQNQGLEATAKSMISQSSISLETEIKDLEINFRTPYGFIGASLLSEYDNLVQVSYELATCGLISNKQRDRIIRKATRSIRGVYHSVSAFKESGITRADIKENNELSASFSESYGDVPASILNRSKSPEFLPTETSQPTKLHSV